MDIITEYAENRDKAIVESIREDSVEPFKAFINKYREKGFYPIMDFPSDEVLSISIRQMCLHCTRIEPSIKGMAVDWLLTRGYDLDFTK